MSFNHYQLVYYNIKTKAKHEVYSLTRIIKPTKKKKQTNKLYMTEEFLQTGCIQFQKQLNISVSNIVIIQNLKKI